MWLAVRWLHVITAIAWIGSSASISSRSTSACRKRPACRRRRHGEEWQVHGGGFYHIQKYLVAPARCPST
jgi:uncharacterized membrane protein